MSLNDDRLRGVQLLDQLRKEAPEVAEEYHKRADGPFVDFRILIGLLHEAMFTHRNKKTRLAAAKYVLANGSLPRPDHWGAELVDALKGPDATSREIALCALRGKQVVGETDILPLVERIMKNSSTEHRELAVKLVGTFPPDTAAVALPSLVKRLGDEAACVRSAAIKTLAGFGRDAEPAVPELVKVVKDDPDKSIRLEAARTLLAFHPLTDRVVQELRALSEATDRTKFLDVLRQVGAESRPLRQELEQRWADQEVGGQTSVELEDTAEPAKGAIHPDGPDDPYLFWWDNRYHKMTPLLFNLARALWRRKKIPELDDVMEKVWGSDDGHEKKLKVALSRLNTFFLVKKIPLVYHQKGKFIFLDE